MAAPKLAMQPRTFILDPGYDYPSGHHSVANSALARLLPHSVYLFGTAVNGEAAGAVYQKRFSNSIYTAHHLRQVAKRNNKKTIVLPSPMTYIRAARDTILGDYFYEIKSIFEEFDINDRDNVIVHTDSSLLIRSLLNVFYRLRVTKRPHLHVRVLLSGHPVTEDPKPYKALADLARRNNKVKIYAELRAVRNELIKRFGVSEVELVRLVLPPSETPPDRKARVRFFEQPTITFAGQFRNEKGWKNLPPIIDSLRRMKPNVMPRFLVSGTNSEAHYFHDPEDHIGQLRRAGAEVRLGPLSNGGFVKLLDETDVLVLPYDADAFRLRGSGVALDAIVNGIPMVVTAGSALTEFIEAGNGVARSGIDGFAEALKLVTEDYDRYADQAIVARDQAREWMNANAIVAAVDEHCRTG